MEYVKGPGPDDKIRMPVIRCARIGRDNSGYWTALLWEIDNRWTATRAIGFPTVQAAVRRADDWLRDGI